MHLNSSDNERLNVIIARLKDSNHSWYNVLNHYYNDDLEFLIDLVQRLQEANIQLLKTITQIGLEAERHGEQGTVVPLSIIKDSVNKNKES